MALLKVTVKAVEGEDENKTELNHLSPYNKLRKQNRKTAGRKALEKARHLRIKKISATKEGRGGAANEKRKLKTATLARTGLTKTNPRVKTSWRVENTL